MWARVLHTRVHMQADTRLVAGRHMDRNADMACHTAGEVEERESKREKQRGRWSALAHSGDEEWQ